jgi:pimeloyl-ACP methyl ester carboxylesterase
MPSYGACSGKPTPGSIKDSIKVVIPAAANALNWTLAPSDSRLRFFGHSLGAAVSLEAAREFDIRRGVILTPFTSTMDMAHEMTGLPVGFLVRQRFDNTKRLKEMAKRGDAEVFVIHGSEDEAIPVEMSRTLAKEAPEVVRYTEVPRGRHNDLQDIAPAVLTKAMAEARR